MSEMTDVDRTIGAWLASTGSDEVPAMLVERALDRAARTSQRGRLALAVAGPGAWPETGPRIPFLPDARTARILVVALLALAIIGASIVVGGRLIKPPTPIQLTYDGTLTLAGTFPNGFVFSDFGAAQLADGRVVSESGEPLSAADSEALLVWDHTGATHHELGRTRVLRQQARLLPRTDGRLLLIGGDLERMPSGDARGAASTAEIFDPAAGRSAEVIHLQAPRSAAGVVDLGDGRILVAGGSTADDTGTPVPWAEVLDPESGSSRLVGEMRQGRVQPSMALLPNGRVLVVGGGGSSDDARTTAELFDPATGSFTRAPELAPAARGRVETVALRDGRVLLVQETCVEIDTTPPDAQGRSSNFAPTPVDVYDPAGGAFSRIGVLPHCANTATLLASGQVLVTGYYSELNHGELWAGLYDPATERTRIIASPLGHYIRVVALADGRALLFSTPDGGNFEGAAVQLLK